MNRKTESTKPKYFYCYLDNEVMLQHLSDEQAGILWKKLFAYTNRGENATISDPVVAMAFDVMTQQINRDFKKYQEKCEQNRQNRAKANDSRRTSTIVNVGDQYKEKDKEKDKEKEENKDKENNIDTLSTCVDSRCEIDCQAVVEFFNSICVSLPRVLKLSDKRRRKIKNAYKLLNEMTFEEFFRIVENSDFLTGRNESWNGCGFDWILNPSNMTKIIEGNYNNKDATSLRLQQQKVQNNMRNNMRNNVRNYDEEF